MTFSSSEGWPDSGPIESVRRAPLTSEPSTNVASRRAMPAAAHVYLYVRSQASERIASASTVTIVERDQEPHQLELARASAPCRRTTA